MIDNLIKTGTRSTSNFLGPTEAEHNLAAFADARAWQAKSKLH
jgi:hypothetical protein